MNKQDLEHYIKLLDQKFNYEEYDISYWLHKMLNDIKKAKFLTKEQLYDKTRSVPTDIKNEMMGYLIEKGKVKIKKRRLNNSQRASTIYYL